MSRGGGSRRFSESDGTLSDGSLSDGGLAEAAEAQERRAKSTEELLAEQLRRSAERTAEALRRDSVVDEAELHRESVVDEAELRRESMGDAARVSHDADARRSLEGGGGAGGGPAPEEVGGAVGWEEYLDEEGRPYYHHAASGESRWDRPSGWQPAAGRPVPPRASMHASAAAAAAGGSPRVAAAGDESLVSDAAIARGASFPQQREGSDAAAPALEVDIDAALERCEWLDAAQKAAVAAAAEEARLEAAEAVPALRTLLSREGPDAQLSTLLLSDKRQLLAESRGGTLALRFGHNTSTVVQLLPELSPHVRACLFVGDRLVALNDQAVASEAEPLTAGAVPARGARCTHHRQLRVGRAARLARALAGRHAAPPHSLPACRRRRRAPLRR